MAVLSLRNVQTNRGMLQVNLMHKVGVESEEWQPRQKLKKIRCNRFEILRQFLILCGCTISTSDRELILRTYIVTPTVTGVPIHDYSRGRELALLNWQNFP